MRAQAGPGAPERLPHRQPALVALVTVGGALGTLARYGLTAALGGGDGAGWPVATTVENVLGALLLGALLGALGSGPESPRTRAVRLALGTGVLGGFTTFSTLALEVQRLAAGGDLVLGATYGLVGVAAGVVAAAVGVAAGGRLRRGPDATGSTGAGDAVPSPTDDGRLP